MKLLLFDCNGTIIDDNLPCWQAIEGIFLHYKKTPPTIEEYYLAMDKHWSEVFKARGIEGDNEEFNNIYVPILERLYHTARPFPKVHPTLATLKKRGYTLGIISHGSESINAPVLEQYGLTEFFDPRFVIYGNESKHDAIKAFSKTAGVSNDYCYYIGDAPSDVGESNRAGVQSVAFLPGFIPEYLVRAKNPKHVINTMDELLHVVEK